MKTKIISTVLFFTIIASILSVSFFNVSAETEGIFDYYDEGDYGYSMVAKCNEPVGKVVIPSTLGGNPVVTIHDRAFENATELTGIVIPKSITGIYATSFIGCTNLKDVYYEGSVTEWNKMQIGFESEVDGGIRDIPLFDATIHFNGDKDITGQKSGAFEYIVENKVAIIIKCDRTAKGKVEVPEELGGAPVEAIGNHAFFNCAEIEEIKLPNTITDISSSAFSYCEKLKKINIPDKVIDIKPFAFVECTSLENVELPDSLSEIAMGTFQHSGLKSISIPQSVKTIAYRAFAWCEKLENVKLSKGLETIEEGAFSYTSIKELAFPKGFQKIDMWAITYCEKLEVLILPESINEIGINICEGCINLKSVKYAGTEAEWQKINIIQPNVELDDAEIEFEFKTTDYDSESSDNGWLFGLIFVFLIIVISIFLIVLNKKKKANKENISE